ncbi:calcineurin-like phosphoesterase family protein [Jatrophihabitans sp. GAS493]|uniref:metallophosphoesterase family protein n=1 Tax=Jatrophihabitans sp. GAS493 TaxID=1907575 RepID=UPI000BC01EAD|nr:metallophosphoesterase [Jatrophihabitans sp. GAS493]SOD75075.1 calcineurin-like phosphoesterase family protein [Jatrophihabitans sp. GAS493]
MGGEDPKIVAMAGDWHGNLGWVLRMIPIVFDAGVKVIVQLGDFGYWRDDNDTRKYLLRLAQQLTKRDMQLYWLDGNHEDHTRLQALPRDADGTRPISPGITHLPRGHRWTWHDEAGTPHTWLALGGAVSVDRNARKPGRSWWPEEEITDADVRVATERGPVDVMVTHDAPAGVEVPGLEDNAWPSDALVDADGHRQRLRDVVDVLRPKQLWHGHYHVRYEAELDLAEDPAVPTAPAICQVHGLDCDDSHWARNIVLADVAGRPVDWPNAE